MTKLFFRWGFSLFVLTAVGLLTTPATFCQTEKLGIVNYKAPTGMNKMPKENGVAFSEFDQATGKFCIITLYGATPGTENAQSDFTREWNNLVVKNFTTVEANPKTETSSQDGWTAIGGGGEVEGEIGKAVAFLTVISGFGQTVSVLSVFNDDAHARKVESFVSTIEMDKVRASITNTVNAEPMTPTLDQWGNLFIPPPTRQLTIADLIGNWGDNPGRISTHYVHRDTGSHAGTDSLHFTSKWTIDGDGRYVNDFFEVRNGRKLRDITTGTITIAGRLLTIKHKGTTKYVIRGWLELADMTILKVVGPWHDSQEIPAEIFSNPEQGENLAKKWVRKK